MNVLSSIFSVLLGAGKGLIGTAIRTALAVIAGWLASKGIDVDAGTFASLETALSGVFLAILAGIGSILNNKANKEND